MADVIYLKKKNRPIQCSKQPHSALNFSIFYSSCRCTTTIYMVLNIIYNSLAVVTKKKSHFFRVSIRRHFSMEHVLVALAFNSRKTARTHKTHIFRKEQ